MPRGLFFRKTEKKRPMFTEEEKRVITLDKRDTTSLGIAKEVSELVSVNIDRGSFSNISNEIASLDMGKDYSGIKYALEPLHDVVDKKTLLIRLLCSAVFLYFFVVGLNIVILANDRNIKNSGLVYMIIAFIFIYLNISGFFKSKKEDLFFDRYERYRPLLNRHHYVLIDDLVDFSGQQKSCVIEDLKRAIKMKLIPQGHLGRNDTLFLVCDEAYLKYQEMPNIYDKYFRKKAEERLKEQSKSEEIKEILGKGEYYVNQIHDKNKVINDNDVSAILDKMESIIREIMHEVDMNPSNANKLGMLLSYYLPTTQKMLDVYIDIIQRGKVSDTQKYTLMNITNSLGALNDSFEAILNKFYQEQELDISTDIEAMNQMLAMEGLKNN